MVHLSNRVFCFCIPAVVSNSVRFQDHVHLDRTNLQDVIDSSMAKCDLPDIDQLFVNSGLMHRDVPGLFFSSDNDTALISCGTFPAEDISNHKFGIQITDGSPSSLLLASREISLHFHNGMAAIGYCSASTLGTDLLPAESYFQLCSNVFFEFDQ